MKGLLKFITCGSVDDGKSTLIGHILYDAKLLFADQEKALELDSRVGSREGKIDYSLLLDGLMAEREQGITIDVAYRYLTTDNRSFIVADTPGHEEYTRNMAVGASFADLAIILVDAKQGVLVQTRRHARICSLMGIRYYVFAVNKMDLVQYSQERYQEIEMQIQELATELSLAQIHMIPVSATEGDNITKQSPNMPWYTDTPLLNYLENVDVEEKQEEKGFYMPVQRVCRPNHSFRGFQGQIEAGMISVGDEVTALPSNEKALVKSILITDKENLTASKGQPVTIQLDREVDVSRGCVLSKTANLKLSNQFDATILWMDDKSLIIGEEYLIKLGTKQIPCVINEVKYSINVNSGEHQKATEIGKNEIALCKITLAEKIVVDQFIKHKTMGELILLDRVTNMTAACGVVEEVRDKIADGTVFVSGGVEITTDIFSEYQYLIQSRRIVKENAEDKRYLVGDYINLSGISYSYPEDIDIVSLKNKKVIRVRGGIFKEVIELVEFILEDTPVINELGFGLKINSKEQQQNFKIELSTIDAVYDEAFYNKWFEFETYHHIIVNN